MFSKNLPSILKVFTKALSDLESFIDIREADRDAYTTQIEEATRKTGIATTDINQASAVKRKLQVILDL